MEPNQLGNKTFEEWINLDLNTCISTNDRECNPHDGDIIDTQMVIVSIPYLYNTNIENNRFRLQI